jgi:hypothetical protein
MGRRPWTHQCHAPSRGGQCGYCYANDAAEPPTQRRPRDEGEDGHAGRKKPGIIVGGVMWGGHAVITGALRGGGHRVRGMGQTRHAVMGGDHQAQRDDDQPQHAIEG